MLRATLRSLGYLSSSLLAGPVAFLWSLVSTIVVGLLSLTQLGGPVFLGAIWVTRHLAAFERNRAALVLDSPIGSPYVPVKADGIGRRVVGVAAQPATWRDLVWLSVLFPLGLLFGVPAVVCTVVSAAAVSAPLWAWAVPNPNAPFPMNVLMLTLSGRFALAGAGLLLLVVTIRLIRVLARAQARTASALLAPGRHQHLVDEAARLSESRRRVVDAQAAELRRIERDLHDGAQARIVAAGMTLALAARKLGNEHAAVADVDMARRQLDDALGELRRLVRGIHPPILTDRGLHAAVSALAGDSPLPVEVDADPAVRFPAAVESAAYFVIAEGLVNASKHADAGQCVVSITKAEDRMTVTVADDGHGGADPHGSGLEGLRRRIEALDGELTVTSPAGGPTALHAEIPL
ncbi:sensor histidine kinase [Actinoplanes utahensis]|uniref:histidine kinase n=1 Tax=Actinoplanes utahensis TaxID=1869 RepID=A0A0A6UR03_ACTUT|nr:sensor histidine kinase [Actinoplanes utahensis]KHD76809.1 histidine kinase [Actinoplanes utahensis]GIF33382.1 histidine kinase [Actinoplanes utahensis]